VKQTQTENQIEEEHPLNFVVNSLSEQLPIDLADGAKVSTEMLYEVLAGASTSGISINRICKTTEDSPHANTIRGYLTDQFDLDPYYGDEDETEALYSSLAKRGTTTFHAYATLYARVRNKRYTLGVRQLVAGEKSDDVLSEFFELLDGLDLRVKPSTLSEDSTIAPV